MGTFSVPYVPLERIAAVEPRLEPGLVINIVKAPRADLLVRISHQGLIVKKGEQLLVRNATSVGPRAVVDEPWPQFLEKQRAARSWPTVGFNFLRVRNR